MFATLTFPHHSLHMVVVTIYCQRCPTVVVVIVHQWSRYEHTIRPVFWKLSVSGSSTTELVTRKWCPRLLGGEGSGKSLLRTICHQCFPVANWLSSNTKPTKDANLKADQRIFPKETGARLRKSWRGLFWMDKHGETNNNGKVNSLWEAQALCPTPPTSPALFRVQPRHFNLYTHIVWCWRCAWHERTRNQQVTQKTTAMMQNRGESWCPAARLIVVISQTHWLVSQERLSPRAGSSVFIDLPITPSGEWWF